MKTFSKILATIILLGASVLFGQAGPIAVSSLQATATGAGSAINLTSSPVSSHQLTWRPSGTVTTCTVALDSSADGITWTPGGVITGQTCTSNGSTQATVNAQFVRFNVTVFTGTGTVSLVYAGSVAIGQGNNSGAPAGNVGALTFISNAVNPTWNEGNQVLGSVDLKGNQRVTTCGAGSANCTAVATNNAGPVAASALSLDTMGFGYSINAANNWIPNGLDPCQNSAIAKSSVVINISTAATTALVAVSGSTTVFVCGFSLTISEVVTTANTILFEQGTGATCAGAPTALTGTYGAGGVLAAAPITVVVPGGSTAFKTAASNGLCAVTAIGATGSFQGVLTFVQQ